MYYDYIILGGGIAGLSLARSLLEHGKKVMLLDTQGIGHGASGAPASLGNPATGPKAKLIWRAEACYKALTRQLEIASLAGVKSVFQISGVLRPGLDRKQARKMKEQFDQTSWPAGWAYWLDEAEVANLNSELACTLGGVWLPAGLTIDTEAYLYQLYDYLIENGLAFEVAARYSLNQSNQEWILETEKSKTYKAAAIIDCTGYEITRSEQWSFLPLEAVKGQLAVFNLDTPLPGRYALAGGGYIARITDRRIVVGSTYEHNFETTQSTEEGIQTLKVKLLRLLPYLEGKIEFSDTWTGIRVSAEDHKPVLGRHPETPGLYVFTGLGSKGMLYSAYLADCLSAHLTEGQALPEEVDIERFV